jgi:hypothetical protein
VTVFLAGLALLFGPPSPVLHSQGDQVTAARGSYCWAGESDANGLEPYICADVASPAPASKRALPVRRGGRVRVDMRTDTDSLTATLRGREGELSVEPADESKRWFVVRLPKRLKQDAVLDLHANYPKGDASFGTRLSTPLPSGPPRPVLRAGHDRLVMARGSYCWTKPPVGLCVDTLPPTTKDALHASRGGKVRVDMRTDSELPNASIRRGPRDLKVERVGQSKRRYVVQLPRRMRHRAVLELFARYPEGDGSFGGRLRVR